MKMLFRCVSVILAALLIGVLLISSGCLSPKDEGFAIYLTKNDIPPSQMEALSHVNIAEEPVIAMSDIVTYNAQTHEIKLTDSAFERIINLEVPVQGRSFLICVDKQPVYWGAFWTPISSMSFDGVTIWKPLGSQDTTIISLELGYPSVSFYGGEDPRSNPDVMEALEESGKLINKLAITDIDKLPRSVKGYELYSWSAENQWHFTLITGTNRNKTPEEIVSEDDFISETGWVKIHVVGVDAIKTVLNKIHQGEFVFWCDGLRLTEPDASIQLPPEEIVENIKTCAEECGLEFTVTLH